jgi:hypothetical protein
MYFLTQFTSCLGQGGPLGALGPVQELGPTGTLSIMTYSHLITGLHQWGDYAEWMGKFGGDLSEAGPLGPNGPIAKYDMLQNGLEGDTTGFTQHLQAEGVWGVLGPANVLGAVGLLGPLGPLGGIKTNDKGEYLKDGNIIRSVSVPFNGAKREFDLYELYDSSSMDTERYQDTSWAVKGVLSFTTEDWYKVESPYAQTAVSFIASASAAYCDVDIAVYDQNKNLLQEGDTVYYADFVTVFNVQKGQRFKIKVTQKNVIAPYVPYRLFVTGTTPYIPARTDFSGSYLTCNKS